MKKLLLTITMLLFTTTCFAAPITHTNTSANIKVQTQEPWQKSQTKQTSINKVPAYQIEFLSTIPMQTKLAILILDGRGNESFKQTAEDFQKGNAKLILEQLTKLPPKDGFELVQSEIKKLSGNDYIYLKYQNNQTIRYNIMTVIGQYNIAINCQTTPEHQQQAEQNLELMMQTISLINEG